MLHILWLIIKCILILLGILVALFLLALALVLFCPLCYQGKAQKDSSKTAVQGKLTWLFCAISLEISYKNREGSACTVRFFGIPADKWKAYFGKLHPKKKKSSLPSEREELSPAEKTGIEFSEDTQTKDSGKKKETALEHDCSPSPNDEKKRRGLAEKIKGVFSKIKHSLLRGWRALKRFLKTARSLCERTQQLKEFLQDERTRAAIQLIWKNLRRLLRQMWPRKITGYIHFGLENPAATGQLLGLLGVTCPIHKNKISVFPDFEKEIFEGELYAKGRIYGVVLAAIAWELYRNRDLRTVIQKMRKG